MTLVLMRSVIDIELKELTINILWDEILANVFIKVSLLFVELANI